MSVMLKIQGQLDFGWGKWCERFQYCSFNVAHVLPGSHCGPWAVAQCDSLYLAYRRDQATVPAISC